MVAACWVAGAQVGGLEVVRVVGAGAHLEEGVARLAGLVHLFQVADPRGTIPLQAAYRTNTINSHVAGHVVRFCRGEGVDIELAGAAAGHRFRRVRVRTTGEGEAVGATGSQGEVGGEVEGG